ncbi:MAG: hypothetical protein JZU63_06295, partial [Rhodoferax sp.]|nr:hypothetical protein [Rhodoferax sp.]
PATSTSDGLGALRVNYLRGVRTQEGAATNRMRTRGSVLGDIINSGPVYKKEADTDIAADSAYASFANTMTGRTATVYVGANDGMLHAFRASDGKELFAYVPLAVAANLNKLTNPNYQHTVYVDGVPQVGEAKLGSSWRTVLVSGMGDLHLAIMAAHKVCLRWMSPTRKTLKAAKPVPAKCFLNLPTRTTPPWATS